MSELLRHTRKLLTWFRDTRYSALSLQGVADLFGLSKPSISNMANPLAKQQLQEHHLENADLRTLFSYAEDKAGLELLDAHLLAERAAKNKTTELTIPEKVERARQNLRGKTAQPNTIEILLFVKGMKDLTPQHDGMYELSVFNYTGTRSRLGIDENRRPTKWLDNHSTRDFIRAAILIETGLTREQCEGVFEERGDKTLCNGTILIKYLTWVSPELDARLHEIIDGATNDQRLDVDAIVGRAVDRAVERVSELYTKLLEEKGERLEAEKERSDKLNMLVKELGSQPNAKDVRYLPSKTNKSKMKKALRELYGLPDNLAVFTTRLWMRLCWWYELFYNVQSGQRRPGDHSRVSVLDEGYESRVDNGSSFYTTIPLPWDNQQTGRSFTQRQRRQLFEINVMAGILTQALWPINDMDRGMTSTLNPSWWEKTGKGGMFRFRTTSSVWVKLSNEELRLPEDALDVMRTVHTGLVSRSVDDVYRELNSKILELGGGVNGEVASDVYMEDPENKNKRTEANGS